MITCQFLCGYIFHSDFLIKYWSCTVLINCYCVIVMLLGKIWTMVVGEMNGVIVNSTVASKFFFVGEIVEGMQ